MPFHLDDASTTEYKDLISELKILIHIGQNKHIVNLLAACTKGLGLSLFYKYDCFQMTCCEICEKILDYKCNFIFPSHDRKISNFLYNFVI